jgi:GNAT superfamily N-acetyltransferase
MTSELKIRIADPHGDDAKRLIAQLSTELAAMYPEDTSAGAGAFKPADVTGPDGRFVIAWLGDRAVGCAALRPMEPGVVEFKRLYVEPEVRSRGISRELLKSLEQFSRELGYSQARAETGLRQPRSMSLLESAGYQRIPNFGIYVGNALSVCFEKNLT